MPGALVDVGDESVFRLAGVWSLACLSIYSLGDSVLLFMFYVFLLPLVLGWCRVGNSLAVGPGEDVALTICMW